LSAHFLSLIPYSLLLFVTDSGQQGEQYKRDADCLQALRGPLSDSLSRWETEDRFSWAKCPASVSSGCRTHSTQLRWFSVRIYS